MQCRASHAVHFRPQTRFDHLQAMCIEEAESSGAVDHFVQYISPIHSTPKIYPENTLETCEERLTPYVQPQCTVHLALPMQAESAGCLHAQASHLALCALQCNWHTRLASVHAPRALREIVLALRDTAAA